MLPLLGKEMSTPLGGHSMAGVFELSSVNGFYLGGFSSVPHNVCWFIQFVDYFLIYYMIVIVSATL